jgi:hypothetical protein
MHHLDDGRSLIRQVFRTEVDLIPDPQTKTLTVRLHPLTAEVHDQVVKYLCEELTSTETVFPCTDLRLVYEIAGLCAFASGSRVNAREKGRAGGSRCQTNRQESPV